MFSALHERGIRTVKHDRRWLLLVVDYTLWSLYLSKRSPTYGTFVKYQTEDACQIVFISSINTNHIQHKLCILL
jgi:hypothetical protein